MSVLVARGLGRPAGMAVAAFACVSAIFMSGCVCTLERCFSGAFFSLPTIAPDDAARLDGATIEICHNDVCGKATLPDAPSTTATASSGAVEDSIHSSVEVLVWRYDADDARAEATGYDVGYTIDVNIGARHSVLVDGDVYSATVTAADGSHVTSTSLRAASHREFYPNGEHCPHERACRVAELTPL